MIVRWWRPDRAIERGPWWVALDVAVAWASAGIAFGSSEYVASLTGGPLVSRVAVVVWFCAIGLRRLAPATALWAGAAATVTVMLAGEPVTNLSLASALPLTMIAQGRRPTVSVALSAVPVLAVVGVMAAHPQIVLVAAVHAVAWGSGTAGRTRKEREARLRRQAAEERAQRVRADERALLAQELHDAVGHAVTLMATHAGAARLSLPDGPPQVTAALSRIEEAGRDAMADLDRVIGLLSDRQSLAPGLRELVRGLPVEVELTLGPGLDDLDPSLAETLRRVAQESLTNVIRHARASRAAVEVTRDEGQVRLVVADDGTAGTPASTGRGLAGMRGRVERVGGTLTAGPAAPEAGWRVVASVPLGQDRP
ncbi:sensor histidine kinase [Nonomuraea endophytica]|uniref:sensor histidine kinase n=1 Tax=Nonomuraea endophytica TaxID=714136 RepID=UPI0037C93D32